MIKVWFLYFTVVSNSTEETIYAERHGPYFSEKACHTSMTYGRKNIANSRWRSNKKYKLKNRIWGKNSRREFDCLDFLYEDSDASTLGNDRFPTHELET